MHMKISGHASMVPAGAAVVAAGRPARRRDAARLAVDVAFVVCDLDDEGLINHVGLVGIPITGVA